MARDIWQEGIILRCRRVQDFHKGLVYLSRTGGIHEAILHGAYKGKGRLAGSTEAFCRLKLMLYHNPVKDSWKLNDGELISSYDGIRGDLARVYLATLWAELLMATRGAGGQDSEAEAVFFLLAGALEILETIPREHLPRLNGQFLWRFLDIAGFGLDFRSCGRCGRPLEGQDIFFYDPRESGFFCSRCLLGTGGLPVSGGLPETGGLPGESGPGNRRYGLPPGFFRYLNYTLSRDLFQALRVDLAGGTADSVGAAPGYGGLETVELIPLDFLKREMGFSPKTPDYRLFL